MFPCSNARCISGMRDAFAGAECVFATEASSYGFGAPSRLAYLYGHSRRGSAASVIQENLSKISPLYHVCKNQQLSSNEVERTFTQSSIFAEIRSEAFRSSPCGCAQNKENR